MKKVGIFMIIGALAWSLQACTNNPDRDDMDSRDSIYNDNNNNNPNISSPMTDDTLNMDPLDTMGSGNMP